MNFVSVSDHYRQQFLKIDQKYLYEFNNEQTRQSMIREYYSLFDRKFMGRFVDRTTPEQVSNGHVNIVVDVNGKEMSILDFCNLMETYVTKFEM